MINKDENISFVLKDAILQENDDEDEENDLLSLISEFNKLVKNDNQLHLYYNETYSVQQLLKICDYYGFLKYVKIAKYKKNDIIDAILLYELNETNNEIVARRQQLWAMMEELVNDKFMKKYILWN